MRHKFLFLIIALVSIFAFLPVNSAFAEEGSEKTGPLEASCKISSCQIEKGKVLVRIYPSTEWTEAGTGTLLHAKDAVKTDAASSLVLEFPNKTNVSIKPDTEIIVEELVWSDTSKKVLLNALKGEFRTIIPKTDSRMEFKVKTPNTICQAGGTVFYVRVTPTGTSVYVSDGSVIFTNPISGEMYTVTVGMVITMSVEGSVSGPAPAPDIDVTGWTAFYSDAVAEPYTPPEGGGNLGDVNPPGIVEESPASRT